MWRTGVHVRSAEVRAMHGLAANEKLLGWLYVGGVEERDRAETPRREKHTKVIADEFITELTA